MSMRRDRTYDEGTTAKALGRLFGGVQEIMQKAGTWHESMRLSVDLRRRTLYLVHKDVGRVLTQLTGEPGSQTTRLDKATLLKFGVTEAAMEEAAKAASDVLATRQ